MFQKENTYVVEFRCQLKGVLLAIKIFSIEAQLQKNKLLVRKWLVAAKIMRSEVFSAMMILSKCECQTFGFFFDFLKFQSFTLLGKIPKFLTDN